MLAALLAFASVFQPSGWSRADAGKQSKASEVASLVQSFYDQTKTFQAKFRQTQFTKIYNRYERAQGRVVFKKPGKMRWDYRSPNGQVFVSDGRKLVVYQPPEEGERHGQLFERAMNADQLPEAFSFLTGTGRLDTDFTIRLLDSRRYRFRSGHVLELRPREPSPNYDRVLFFVQIVNSGSRRAGVIKRVMIIDSLGNRNRFDFRDLQFNRKVSEKRFSFRPPAGTRRIQP